jgi:hypothetical protein
MDVNLTLYVVVPTFGKPAVPYNFTVMDAVVAELDEAIGGTHTGVGGNDGYLTFGYRVAVEAAARDALARAMEKHLPGAPYHVRVGQGAGVNSAFEVLKEFTGPKLALRRADGQPFGTFEQTQALICRLFPGTEFRWTPSGPERVRSCEEKGGGPLTPDLRQWLEKMPSELEGVAEGAGYRVTFGLGHREPVGCLRMTALGSAPELERGLASLEADTGAKFQASE